MDGLKPSSMSRNFCCLNVPVISIFSYRREKELLFSRRASFLLLIFTFVFEKLTWSKDILFILITLENYNFCAAMDQHPETWWKKVTAHCFLHRWAVSHHSVSSGVAPDCLRQSCFFTCAHYETTHHKEPESENYYYQELFTEKT